MGMNELTKVEELIMRVIWNAEKEVTFYDIQEALKEKFNKDYKRSTIRTYITALEKKGLITLERRGLYTYVESCVEKKKYQMAQIEEMKKNIFSGSTKGMLSALSDVVSDSEKQKIKRLIDELDD
ncbi:MAG: BlaI/MecI/CopY family transcriptional regulator [Anaerostipes sp.]|jgi:BlaI family penicillinase repressor|nr:BlaI/MecI/CopY family transcriptional regulator [Anaerostipes sp.]